MRVIKRPGDFRYLTLKDKESRGIRNFMNYFEDSEFEEIIGFSIDKWRKYLKIKSSGVVEVYVSDEEILDAFLACPDELKPVFKLLVYSGSRFSHIYGMLKGFDTQNVIVENGVAHYPTSGLSKGAKKTFHVYFPSSFLPELENVSELKSEDYILRMIKHGRVSAKTIRKWHLNFMIGHGVQESVADFIQGRAAVTVGSAHYLNKVKQATDSYGSLILEYVV
ncbi:integrase [Methanofollis fontis]|uniref:Integrase SSV1 C-terminal domain-containing protein n=1 Tax=Methanofollis fontis TaxID=2052832 RepID=A0A483CNQ0_9EURY|nr:integrase [Methanofollis fontis]TAJ44232.1 hypothetical protein CUJ86_09430 [Methanofollis fontis]